MKRLFAFVITAGALATGAASAYAEVKVVATNLVSNSLGTTLQMWRDQAPALRERFRLARLEILSPAAHLANVESPEAMTGAILEHLQAAPREET